ncbi:hypothetical protein IM543_03485 [Massilia sp. UMI-21]|nr:hypothetical protein IM543_03485 [Massilia sp. UMI-21]
MSNNKQSSRSIHVSSSVNQRMIRLVRALLCGTVTREDADRIAGCSNSPDLIAEIRRLGLGRKHLVTTLFKVIDRDGRVSHPGRYSLTSEGHAMLTEWLNSFVQKHTDEAEK